MFVARPWILVSLGAFSSLAPATAFGERAWQLVWQAPPGCPSAAHVEARVVESLGDSPVGPPLRVTASVTREHDGWQLVMVARRAGAQQRRSLRHHDCAALADATALLVALAVDPARTVVDPHIASLLRTPAQPTRPRASPPARPTSRAPEDWVAEPFIAPPAARAWPEASTSSAAASSAAAAPPSVAPPPRPAPLPRRLERWAALRVGGGLAAGVTPAIGGGVFAAAALALGRRARVELTGSYSAPTRARLASDADRGADISLTTGGLRGCGVPGRGIVEAPLCLGVELGSMRAAGIGLADSRVARSLWSALSVGAAIAVAPISRLAVWFAVDGQVAFNRPQFLIERGGEIWRGGRGGVRATLGIEVRFRAK